MSDKQRSAAASRAGSGPATSRPDPSTSSSSSSDASAKAVQLRRLVQKKERLKYAVDRLELQNRQKERELRKSMAVQ